MQTRRTHSRLLAAAALALAGCFRAARGAESRAAAAQPTSRRSQFEKFTLPNGLDVILSQDHRLPIVAVNLWYHVGPANEEAGRTGFAHLFEHLMFQGSKHMPPDSHFQLLEAAGATDINGTTDYDRTNYFETVPAQSARAGALARVRSHGLPARHGRSEGVREPAGRRPQRAAADDENRPYGNAEEELVQHALSAERIRTSGNVIGSHADIQAAKLDDVQASSSSGTTRRTTRASRSSATSIRAQAKKLVEKYFGTLKRGAAVPPITAETPKITVRTAQGRAAIASSCRASTWRG